MKRPETIKTVLHAYHFNNSCPEEHQQYCDLKEKLKGLGLKMFDTISTTSNQGERAFRHKIKSLDGKEVTLETAHVFNNQWNSAPIPPDTKGGLRLMDWEENIFPNPLVKEGYWLEQTAEMRQVRDNTFTCGYCGKHQDAPSSAFCPECIDSEYLTEDELHLTRMQAASDTSSRVELTEKEAAEILPFFLEAQIHGKTARGKERIKKEFEKLKDEKDGAIGHATTEYAGMVWLIEHAVSRSNVIYYKHTGQFSFGWRKVMGKAEQEKMTEALEDFPYEYQFNK